MHGRLVGSVGLALLAAGGLAGCPNNYTCADNQDCPPDASLDSGADVRLDVTSDAPSTHLDGGVDVTTDATTRGDSTVADGTADAAPDTTADTFVCDPMKAPSAEPCVISETYGVFVAPAANGGSDTAGTGTRLAPYASISTGITKAKAAGKRVYACAATYAEQLVVNAAVDGVDVFGGLACPAAADAAASDAGSAAWAYSGSLAKVEPAAVGYALDVESLATGAHFEDMAFAPQVAPTAPGASSIAVMVNASAGVSFTRVSATALAGVAGKSPASVSPGGTGDNWCPASTQVGSNSGGGAGGQCVCPVAMAGGATESSTGGPGGGATANGLSGTSVPAVAAPLANFGAGSSAAGSGGFCANGHAGASGATEGAGGTAGSAGALNAAGWSGQTAGAGPAGNPGQGGGGGGGSGAVGGAGGGAGGCGGAGGGGGSGGGASIAAAVVDSSVAFAAVSLKTASGGPGGTGAAGESGQTGGAGGSNGVLECFGGTGGAGSGGAGGGGGAGGPSVGIAWTGTSTALTIDGASTTTSSALASPSSFISGGGGASGPGGNLGSAASGGTPGVAGAPGPPGASSAVLGV